jgi:hypothetical protein
MRPVCHKTGEVTYWSVYQQRWVERTNHVPDAELAAMGARDRARVQRALARLTDEGA